MIILVGLLSSLALKSETYQRIPVLGLAPIDNMYASFKILTPKYEKVILDCQSFIHNMSFFEHTKVVREIRMVSYNDCGDVYDFIEQSMVDKKPICMEVEEEGNTLNLSNDSAVDCQ